MPIDILLDICRHLHPKDVLVLARSSKAFREILMSHTATSAWRDSRDNVPGLPDCPTHMSEPAYADLLFMKYCQSCLQPHAGTPFWDFHARYCKRCEADTTISLVDIKLPPRLLSIASEVLNVNEGRCHIPHVVKLMHEWNSLQEDSEAQDRYIEMRRTTIQDMKKSVRKMQQAISDNKRVDVMVDRLLAFGSHITSLPRDASKLYQPTLSDFAAMPEFRQDIECPNDTKLTEDTFVKFRAQLHNMIQRWQRYNASILALKLPVDEHILKAQGTGVLLLAMVCFDCTRCHQLLRFPEILAHDPSCFGQLTRDSLYKQALTWAGCCAPWSEQRFRVSPSFKRCEEIIRICRLDPFKTTRHDMDALDVRVCCDEGDLTRVLTWDKAMEEEHQRAVKGSAHATPVAAPQWRRATEAELSRARKAELAAARRLRKMHALQPYWCCAHCTHGLWSAGSIRAHLRTEVYANDDPTSLFLHPDGSRKMHGHVILEKPGFETEAGDRIEFWEW
ncbi:hypothetical protein WOLCODRAFT_155148 [Wolfiporia cocos MD-104 SS10]|uniref:F-box domain-containing protein n=1 Tax=Wolfiporia cocos (strain MD-104) TaxID=742152 RepID=A0A2H3JSL9_WOLCO|nr:hypothetical protein WOLCODRAFT_155148 [Wolfiporia cocos MD-104 SS10]